MKQKKYLEDRISPMFNKITAREIRRTRKAQPPPEKSHWLHCRHLVLGGDFFPDMDYGQFYCALNHLTDPYAECERCAFFKEKKYFS